MKKQGWLFNLFGQAVKDKSPEEIEQMAMDAAAAFDEDGKESGEIKNDPPPGKTEDAAVVDAIVDKVMEKIAAKEAEKKEEEKKSKGEDSLEAAISQLTGDKAREEESSRVILAEDADKNCGMDKALAASILKAMRPSVAAIKDEAQRKAVSDALIQCVTAQDGTNDIAAIMQAIQKNAQTAADRAPAVDNDAIQAKYDAMNPHKRKETME